MAFTSSEALTSLTRANAAGRLAHAYLISGADDRTRREVAACLAAVVRGLPDPQGVFPAHPDVQVLEPESKSRRIGIEQVRALTGSLSLRSLVADGRKVGIILEADRITIPAANAFLKTLEEPPPFSLLLLVTSRPEGLLETILSRCIRVDLRSTGVRELTPREEALHRQLEEFATRPAPTTASVTPAYRLLRGFQQILSEAKTEIRAGEEAEFSAEEDKYDRRDYGDWLNEREDYHKIQVETRYLAERDVLIGALARWWGDRLRNCLNSGDTAQASAILPRIEALEALHEHLGRNVQEALALEAAFLEAFA